MTYKVQGTIELNWENFVDADSEEEANQYGIMMAMDGRGLGDPVTEAEVHSVEEWEDEDEE